jgi:hypothetical protein
MEKLGVKPGARVTVLGVGEPAFREELKTAGADVSTHVRAGSDIVFIGMTSKKDLAQLVKLRQAIKPEGMIWVIWPKGRKEFREDDVRDYGPHAELVDVKVMAFSETLSGLKMVIPLAMRAPAQARAGVRRTPN